MGESTSKDTDTVINITMATIMTKRKTMVVMIMMTMAGGKTEEKKDDEGVEKDNDEDADSNDNDAMDGLTGRPQETNAHALPCGHSKRRGD